jgi:hypothetical protein
VGVGMFQLRFVFRRCCGSASRCWGILKCPSFDLKLKTRNNTCGIRPLKGDGGKYGAIFFLTASVQIGDVGFLSVGPLSIPFRHSSQKAGC